ncbi:MAG: hypothetical protein R3B70_06400 [Polyangiaceae bacterium]
MSRREQRSSMSELTPRRKKEEPAKKPLTVAEVEKNLKASLASTDEGLKKFLASMREARMDEAVHAYRSMQVVLVQQRMWAQTNRRDQLLPLFRSIARTSGEIHRIFSGFAEVMKGLKEVDKIRPGQGTSAARPQAASPAPAEAPEPAPAAEPSPASEHTPASEPTVQD